MTRRITAAMILIALTSAVGTWLFSVTPKSFRGAGSSIGFGAPKESLDFTLPEVSSGKQLHFFQWADGKPVLLIFWATWCPTCVSEVPKLIELESEAKASGLFKILAVHVGQSEVSLDEFMNRQGIDYQVVWDQESKVASEYGVVGLPVAVMLDRAGKILYYGYSLPDLGELIDRLGRKVV